MAKSENLLSNNLKLIRVKCATPYMLFPQTWFSEIRVEVLPKENLLREDEQEEVIGSEKSSLEEVSKDQLEMNLVNEFTIVDLKDAFQSPISIMEP